MEKSAILTMLNQWLDNDGKLNIVDAFKLKKSLEDDLILEFKKTQGKGEAGRYQLIKRFLDKISVTRPVLKYVDIQNIRRKDLMVFTNSYVAFWLNADIPELPHVTENVGKYPVMSGLYESNNRDMYSDGSKMFVIDFAKLNLAIKTKNAWVTVDGKVFDAKWLKLITDIMESNSVTVSYKGSGGITVGMIHIDNAIGYALLLGVRSENEPNMVEVSESEVK